MLTTEQIKEILDETYNRVTDAGKEFTLATALWTLRQLCNGNDALLEACKNNLELYNAGEL